jgi:hypothetical protein
VIERDRDMACQLGSSGGSAERFFFWRLRRAVRGGDAGILVLRFGVRHVHSIPTSWHCFNESEQTLISTNEHRFLHVTRAPNG